jgi:hypothetical protein
MQKAMDHCSIEEEANHVIAIPHAPIHLEHFDSITSIDINDANALTGTAPRNSAVERVSSSVLSTPTGKLLRRKSSVGEILDGEYRSQIVKKLSRTFKSDAEVIGKVSKLVNHARANTEKIVERMHEFMDEYDQEKYLIQSFIASNMSNVIKEKLCAKYFFYDLDDLEDDTFQIATQYLCVILLPLYICGAILYIFLFGVQLGPEVTEFWLNK